MCLPFRQLDPRTRRMMFVANISLVAGLTLWLFVRPLLAEPRAWLDGVCGLLCGVSIAVNLGRLVRDRRRGSRQS